MHGTRINSVGAGCETLLFVRSIFSCLPHFFLAAQSRKLRAGERSGGCQATLRKSRGARAIIARVILPRVRERKAIRSAKLYTASLREERGIGREGGSKISNGGRASERGIRNCLRHPRLLRAAQLLKVIPGESFASSLERG